MKRLIAALATIFVIVAVPAFAAPHFPALTGRVVDDANILSPQVENALSEKLAGLESRTHHQVVVATLSSLQGYEIEEYGYQLGRAWKIGGKENDDGVVLIVAPNERKVRIEVGYGLEGVMTDTLSGVIIQTRILPRFRAGDMEGGVVAGADAIIAQLDLPDDQARAVAQRAASPSHAPHGSYLGVVMAVIFFWVLFSSLMGALFGRRRYRGGGGLGAAVPWLILGALSDASRHRGGWGGGGGWSGGGGGGGGFSGGGGSFGGGGASGGW